MSNIELTSQQRRELRAAAHPLHPVVLIGDRGLTASVLEEIDRSLTAHELVKVRVAGAERDAREAMLATICEALSCAAVHHLGKTLIIYRARPDTQPASEGLNATQTNRRKSDPYVPKKLAAHSHDAKPAAKHKATRGPKVEPSHAGRALPEGRAPRKPRASVSARADSRTRGASAAAHGIQRRSTGGSALTLRAGRRRTSRS
ncbi:MAG TPA: YhbY family RNA-binding protein [Castellaniella sp.]|uniref:YhbY family RNA-binding protein n=1 Tax=Castellaniella sp. TaxID=1955812 RepID=UPI002EE8851F